MKKIILFACIFLIFTKTFAYTPATFYCPTVEEIKSNNYLPWVPIYADIEEPAVDDDVTKFRTHVVALISGIWDPLFLESAHCLYSRDDSLTNNIVLSRDAWRPTSTPKWQWVNNNLAECYSQNVEECGFLE